MGLFDKIRRHAAVARMLVVCGKMTKCPILSAYGVYPRQNQLLQGSTGGDKLRHYNKYRSDTDFSSNYIRNTTLTNYVEPRRVKFQKLKSRTLVNLGGSRGEVEAEKFRFPSVDFFLNGKMFLIFSQSVVAVVSG